jgi:hypothetical protein
MVGILAAAQHDAQRRGVQRALVQIVRVGGLEDEPLRLGKVSAAQRSCQVGRMQADPRKEVFATIKYCEFIALGRKVLKLLGYGTLSFVLSYKNLNHVV